VRFLALLGIVAILAGAAILAGRLFPSEKDRLRERIDACERALEEKDAEALAGMLSESFRFEGEGVVGTGDRERALERVRRLADDPRSLRIRTGDLEAEIDEGHASIHLEGGASWGTLEKRPGQERFEGFHGRFRADLELRRMEGGGWVLESAKIEVRDPLAEVRVRQRKGRGAPMRRPTPGSPGSRADRAPRRPRPGRSRAGGRRRGAGRAPSCRP
jgi:hypothetical protein